MFARIACLPLLIALCCTSALATDYPLGALSIDDPWSRAMPASAPTRAAYFTVRNSGRTDDLLIGAETSSAEKAELHTHKHVGGVMRMQQVDSVAIPAGAEVRFMPSGNHVMLFNPRQSLAVGDHFPLTLQFEKAGKVEIEVNVRKDSLAD